MLEWIAKDLQGLSRQSTVIWHEKRKQANYEIKSMHAGTVFRLDFDRLS